MLRCIEKHGATLYGQMQGYHSNVSITLRMAQIFNMHSVHC